MPRSEPTPSPGLRSEAATDGGQGREGEVASSAAHPVEDNRYQMALNIFVVCHK